LRRKLLICAATVAIFVVIVAAIGTIIFFCPLATRYIEGDAFRIAMESETANGLHFPAGHYSPIRRTSSLTAQAERFEASNGQRALKLVDAHQITATFDPWGVFMRQWSFSPFLEKLAQLAHEKSFEHLELTDCSLNFTWRYPSIEIKNIGLEEKGKFRVQGAISIDRRALRGAIQLGVTGKHLDWLPNREEVFSRQQGGYLWTSVHLSGTIDQPKQDLSPRIIELFKESPGAYLQLLFRQFEQWIKETFGGD